MSYPEEIAQRMFHWYDEGPRKSDRMEAMSKEVSPCSEYTRYTVEGVLNGPLSTLSVLMDVHALGTIFKNSGMKDAKWSDRLGYGMAVIGEDTRIHLHVNGKYVIRRAKDREHAETSYRTLVNLIRPTLYDEDSKRYLWDLLKEYSIRKAGIGGSLKDLLLWPDRTGDPVTIIEKVFQGAGEVDVALLAPLRALFIDHRGRDPKSDDPPLPGDMKGLVLDRMKDHSSEFSTDPELSLGRLAASIWSWRAIEEMELVLNILDRKGHVGPVLGKDPWDGHYIDWENVRRYLGSIQFSVSLARVHYLLAPTMTDEE
ncbi:MAG: hypothetical protein JXA22_07270 [Candidatus Thermoplasmatota archaeon]|nr:hypothetical protein [Candidatus Thermoplasmatota archaeon]